VISYLLVLAFGGKKLSVTIKDVAKKAGVSYSTVSRALSGSTLINEDTRKKVKEIAKQLGYTPNEIAKGLVSKTSSTIGLILPDITNPFFADVAQGIEECANRNGFQVFLCNSNWDLVREKGYLSTLNGKRVGGIIVSPATNHNSHFIEDNARSIPTVFAAYNPMNEEYNYVVTDDYKSSVIATEYILKLGHRNIAFIGGQEENNTNIGRLNGFVATMDKYGMEVRKDYVRYGKYRQESGYELTKDMLLKNEIPSAIIAGNDIIAIGVIQAVEEFGLKVPENISVIGFDDISYASLHKIQLTTVKQPINRIGELCVEMLLELIKSQDIKTGRHEILSPSLIIRKTCKGI
jgi:LacI family transcriptional regulator